MTFYHTHKEKPPWPGSVPVLQLRVRFSFVLRQYELPGLTQRLPNQ